MYKYWDKSLLIDKSKKASNLLKMILLSMSQQMSNYPSIKYHHIYTIQKIIPIEKQVIQQYSQCQYYQIRKLLEKIIINGVFMISINK